MPFPIHDPALGATTQSPLTYISAELRILVVENDPGLRLLLDEILRRARHFVGLVETGEEGLARFRAERWHVVFTNRIRPGMDGDAFAIEIKLLSSATPVVMLTGLPPTNPNTCVDEVIRKPFTCAALGAAITRCLKI